MRTIAAMMVGVKIVRGDQGAFSRLAAMKLWELDVGCSEVGEEARELTQTVPDSSIHVKSPAGPWPLQDATETRQSVSDAIPYRSLAAPLYLREMILPPSLRPLLWHLVMGAMSPAT